MPGHQQGDGRRWKVLRPSPLGDGRVIVMLEPLGSMLLRTQPGHMHLVGSQRVTAAGQSGNRCGVGSELRAS